MNTMLSKMSPSITSMIRMDHTHVLSNFHRWHAETSLERKRAIAETICLALEIHAQLEEEIFYPALREVCADDGVLAESPAEHAEMKELVGQLRALVPGEAGFDDVFLKLMRTVMHHVADEETVLLPAAEERLADRLGELGARMTKRRVELAGPRLHEIASNQMRAMPGATMAMLAGGALAGGWLLKRAMDHRRA